jgi:alpha-1,3-rhamnosyltransferase
MNTNNFPLVSVLIPFYNHNRFIKKTLDSILEDSYPNKEIIIINDGSTDPDDSNITAWIEDNSESIPVSYSKRENRGVTKL